ncbi:MAG: hypothetical protein K5769_03165 [Pseudobutyrivibrio sp.]|nr:hypothetical protein [Pseudobutyrivibrio sp.]
MSQKSGNTNNDEAINVSKVPNRQYKNINFNFFENFDEVNKPMNVNKDKRFFGAMDQFNTITEDKKNPDVKAKSDSKKKNRIHKIKAKIKRIFSKCFPINKKQTKENHLNDSAQKRIEDSNSLDNNVLNNIDEVNKPMNVINDTRFFGAMNQFNTIPEDKEKKDVKIKSDSNLSNNIYDNNVSTYKQPNRSFNSDMNNASIDGLHVKNK